MLSRDRIADNVMEMYGALSRRTDSRTSGTHFTPSDLMAAASRIVAAQISGIDWETIPDEDTQTRRCVSCDMFVPTTLTCPGCGEQICSTCFYVTGCMNCGK